MFFSRDDLLTCVHQTAWVHLGASRHGDHCSCWRASAARALWTGNFHMVGVVSTVERTRRKQGKTLREVREAVCAVLKDEREHSSRVGRQCERSRRLGVNRKILQRPWCEERPSYSCSAAGGADSAADKTASRRSARRTRTVFGAMISSCTR